MTVPLLYMKSTTLLCAATVLLGGLLPLQAEKKSDWQILFDGDSVAQWRGFKKDAFPAGGWKVEEGVLISIGSGDRVDLITRDTYSDFELELEWRVEDRGNSGVFYGGSEEAAVIYHFAPEYQLLDDAGHNTPLQHVQSTGALYDLLGPNEKKKLRPVGDFNHTRIVVRGSEVEHWLNGAKILSYDLESTDVKQRIANSKFKDFEQFARVRNGHIGLQHHGDTVGFRNIRIRNLDKDAAN